MFLIEHQVPLILLFFLSGLFGTALIIRKPARHRAWLVADLVWVVLGLFGALGAIVAGIYKADSSRIERQIDIAYAATAAFDHDAARFRLRYCEDPAFPSVAVLCDRAEFLSASTAENADLPLFIAVTEQVSPLKSLFLLGNSSNDMSEMAAVADAFDPVTLLAFAPLDEVTRNALKELQPLAPGIAGDYRIIAQSYDDLIGQVRRLKDEWEFLQQRSWILLLQIIAICLVSFAAPFRLGKSIVELRRG